MPMPNGLPSHILEAAILDWLNDKDWIKEADIYDHFCSERGMCNDMSRIQFSSLLGRMCTEQNKAPSALKMKRSRGGKAEYRVPQ